MNRCDTIKSEEIISGIWITIGKDAFEIKRHGDFYEAKDDVGLA